MKYQFMEQQRRYHRVEKMARVLEVSRGGYYAWRSRRRSLRARQDERLVAEILYIQEKVAKYRYGSPRIPEELRRRGHSVGHNHGAAPNVVDRDCRPTRVNQVWAGNATSIATAEGWLYLFVIIDLYSRRVIGWAMSKNLGTRTLLQAFWMAVVRRGAPKGLIFHSDRGVRYASVAFRTVLRKKRIIQSMSRKGNSWDNACVESFFKSLKSELIGRVVYESRQAAVQAVFEYIEVFYNRIRLHSTLGYRNPVEYEEEGAKGAA